ncbi:MAG: DNA gyrase inhibitor YacG, partial [Thiohalophilus sp.]
MTRFVKCPTCDKNVPWDESSKWRPFCSERCRLIDLGE